MHPNDPIKSQTTLLWQDLKRATTTTTNPVQADGAAHKSHEKRYTENEYFTFHTVVD